jgi:sugar phosphate isomerase/epimerase
MKPSIWTDAFVELEAEQALEQLAAVGWTTIELAEVHWRRIDDGPEPERRCQALRRQADDLGVAFAQVHGYTFNFLDPDADAAIDRTRRSMAYAAILGIGHYVWHPTSGTWGEEPGQFDAVANRNRDVLGTLADAARSLGIGIAVENIFDRPGPRRSFGTTMDELLWLIGQTDPAVVGVCLDVGHAHVAGLDQHKAITALGPALRATHIQDNDGSSDQHRLPYEGTIDWGAVLRGLREIGYQGAFNLEVGGAVHNTPLAIRPAKLRYALELTAAMVEGRLEA